MGRARGGGKYKYLFFSLLRFAIRELCHLGALVFAIFAEPLNPPLLSDPDKPPGAIPRLKGVWAFRLLAS